MAEGRGGYRRPSNPAPVSGPGALSQRTDGQPARWIAADQYGEGQEMMDVQKSAPMSQTKPQPMRVPRPSVNTAVPQAANNFVPLFAPTQRPDEPVTAGAPFGPGPGPSTVASGGRRSVAQTLEKLLPYDETGSLQSFYQMAVRRGW
jgi:hypothetical protein